MYDLEQFEHSNLLLSAAIFFLSIYFTFFFIRRFVEKSDGDFSRTERRKSTFSLKRFIFTLAYSVMVAGVMYLMTNDNPGTVISFVVSSVIGAFHSGDSRESEYRKSKNRKIFRYIAYFTLFCVLLFITFTSNADNLSKIAAWLILLMLYFLGKWEKKNFTSAATSN
ncbi:hypothetical protein SAMN04487944_12293 [Gracilibacillus ureilyticus]|uniref:Uncharacterized protein n=1 Tax=Gracilibacillus ureilyticus TaxID=531814 RepID=A0A1H9VBB9_9BACI|nr:hypothetical protein SAMN04487944_12293 [Gracilibacillus ureilyticus]